jgi:hypothetical protein
MREFGSKAPTEAWDADSVSYYESHFIFEVPHQALKVAVKGWGVPFKFLNGSTSGLAKWRT